MLHHENENKINKEDKENKATKENKSNHPKRPKRGLVIGIALIAAFLTAPLLFIFIHIYSVPTQETEPYYTDKSNSSYETEQSGQVPSDMEQMVAGLNEDEPGAEIYPDGQNGEHDEEPYDPPDEPVPQIRGTTGVAYLTFDDGPSRSITPGILDILAEEEIRATFFVLPHQRVDDIYWRIIDEGHEIGNHTYSHVFSVLYEGTVFEFKEDVLRARNFIYDNFGYTPTSFRFPGGSLNWSRAIRDPRIYVIRELGYTHFDWHVDTEDWRRDATVESVVRNVLNYTRGREDVIVLMHDNYQVTLDALPQIIDGLREQGYTFDIVRNFPG